MKKKTGRRGEDDDGGQDVMETERMGDDDEFDPLAARRLKLRNVLAK